MRIDGGDARGTMLRERGVPLVDIRCDGSYRDRPCARRTAEIRRTSRGLVWISVTGGSLRGGPIAAPIGAREIYYAKFFDLDDEFPPVWCRRHGHREIVDDDVVRARVRESQVLRKKLVVVPTTTEFGP